MDEKTILIVTSCLMLAAVMIPVPQRSRTILWCVMVGAICTRWVGVSLGYLDPLL